MYAYTLQNVRKYKHLGFVHVHHWNRRSFPNSFTCWIFHLITGFSFPFHFYTLHDWPVPFLILYTTITVICVFPALYGCNLAFADLCGGITASTFSSCTTEFSSIIQLCNNPVLLWTFIAICNYHELCLRASIFQRPHHWPIFDIFPCHSYLNLALLEL